MRDPSKLAKKSPRRGQGLYYDPLYGYIPTPYQLRRAIDLEVFQRLRGIRQLSTLYLVFPGATHTRFEHSIGASFLAKVTHEHLREFLRDTDDAELLDVELDDVTLHAAMLAALLHDIGHGPFGHMFEMFCQRNARYRAWHHEELGERLITGRAQDETEIKEGLFQQIPTFLAELSNVLQRAHGDRPTLPLLRPRNIAALAMGRAPDLGDNDLSARYRFLKDIVPSVFGVDRLDYLRRDAFSTGVRTGDIDIWELIGNLHLRKYSGSTRLLLYPAASPALESLIRARDAVYRHLYHNPIHRSAQELLIRALLELDQPPDELAFLSDSDLLAVFGRSNRPFLTEVEERIRCRVLYEVHQLGTHEGIHAHEKRLGRFWSDDNGWKEFGGLEEQIAQEAGFSSNQRVFYDLVKVPAIKKEDLDDKVFSDPVTGNVASILDLQPHLKTLFEGVLFGDVTRVHAYNDSVSQHYVSFPYDHISDDVKQIAMQPREEWARLAEALYKKKLEPLVEGFYTRILEAPDKDGHLTKPVRDRLNHYLLELIRAKAQEAA